MLSYFILFLKSKIYQRFTCIENLQEGKLKACILFIWHFLISYFAPFAIVFLPKLIKLLKKSILQLSQVIMNISNDIFIIRKYRVNEH